MPDKTALQILTKANLDETHWGIRIVEAEASGKGFCTKDRNQANNWMTCACGMITYDIPRHCHPNDLGHYKQDAPEDGVLYNLGGLFYICISHGNYLEAAKVLVQIEDQARIVAKEYHDARS